MKLTANERFDGMFLVAFELGSEHTLGIEACGSRLDLGQIDIFSGARDEVVDIVRRQSLIDHHAETAASRLRRRSSLGQRKKIKRFAALVYREGIIHLHHRDYVANGVSVFLQSIRFFEEQIVPFARIMLDDACPVQEGRKDADTVRGDGKYRLQSREHEIGR